MTLQLRRYLVGNESRRKRNAYLYGKGERVRKTRGIEAKEGRNPKKNIKIWKNIKNKKWENEFRQKNEQYFLIAILAGPRDSAKITWISTLSDFPLYRGMRESCPHSFPDPIRANISFTCSEFHNGAWRVLLDSYRSYSNKTYSNIEASEKSETRWIHIHSCASFIKNTLSTSDI